MEGDAYERLRTLNVRIVGCGAIITSLALKFPLPEKKRTAETGGLFSVSAHLKTFNKKLPFFGFGKLIEFSTVFLQLYHLYFQIALSSCEIFITNVQKENRQSLMLRALRMGAKVSPYLSSEVTHLVVGEVNSKKYIVASENNITTVTPKWIDDVWNKSG